jgi:DNA-binding response OmpR family regulator
MQMPILDGWGFATESRAWGHTFKILVMTASHNARTAAEEIGAHGWLAKPFDIDDLLSEVDRLCQGAGAVLSG